ncbi:ribosomal protein S18-alanine N-acetyltransferase [Desulfopila sp. IMCC35008]|uniref:ribosomal protein S18-alanine N-acetyltransferase n=1 Tax=Desulfopila sp. IMCC35008 TaxID=2653858 RepID=UPI0013D2D340|nr:ribosomal protein S18-alanine N-acetyltransferase [Desulfopila sp. IMCC35008]
MRVVVRRFTRDDIQAIAFIEQQSVSSWSKEQVSAELDYDRSVSYCAVSESGAHLGWCTARLVGGEAELLKIAVRNDSKRLGIGTLLFNHLVASLHARGVKDLFLEVRSQNIPAIHFYTRLGFQEIGRRNGYYKHPDDDGLLFKRIIEKGMGPEQGE